MAASARLLAPRVGHYTYVSTISVYADYPREPVNEDSRVLDCPADADGTIESLGYGELKAGSERAVAEAFPRRHLIARPGLIVGPHETIGRLPWWLTRIARGGSRPGARRPGPAGPDDRRPGPGRLADRQLPAAHPGDRQRARGLNDAKFGDLLTTCGEMTRADRRTGLDLRWVRDQVLLDAGVEPWTELPMWAPDTPELAGIWTVSGGRAIRTGIRYRPLTDTVHDTWAWLRLEAAAQGTELSEPDRRPPRGPRSAWTRPRRSGSWPGSADQARRR